MIRHRLLATLNLIDLYDTALNNKHPREFRLTLIQTYEFKQTYEIEKNHIIKKYSELLTLEVI